MRNVSGNNTVDFLKQLGWWLFFQVCVFYGLYAFYMGVLEILVLLGLTTDAPQRAAPLIFILHALTGAVALISGPLQFNRRILAARQNVHRLLGRAYVGAIWISSSGGLWSAIFFGVDLAAKIAFGVLSILWFGATTVAFHYIRNGRVEAHQEWMIRSFALSLFFVTFSFWVPALAGTSLPDGVAYPLSVFLSWSLNLLVAELWIQRARAKNASTAPSVGRAARAP